MTPALDPVTLAGLAPMQIAAAVDGVFGAHGNTGGGRRLGQQEP
jgi:hypothetical protein